MDFMKLQVVLWASLMVVAVTPAFSQRAARTITNADLEVYRQERLKAERDYAANYDKMGFPSPEELKAQIEKSRIEHEALSARLAAERLQREQMEVELYKSTVPPEQENIYITPERPNNYYYGHPGGGIFDPWYGYPGRYRRYPRFNLYPWPRGGNGVPILPPFGR